MRAVMNRVVLGGPLESTRHAITTTLLLTGTDLVTDGDITDGDPLRSPDEAQLAAAAFLARHPGRTLEA